MKKRTSKEKKRNEYRKKEILDTNPYSILGCIRLPEA
jgi:hypothetical protein